jgi:hypothetical protein
MSASTVRRIAVACLSLLVLVSPLCAQSGRGGRGGRSGPGTGNPDEHLVPWKFLQKSAELVKGPIVLYWLPASLEEIKRSPLFTSHVLLEATGRCIGLEIVVPDDVVTFEKLGATGKLPMAVLVDSQGSVIRTVNNLRGVLPASAVEQMLADELSARDDAVYRQLTEAKRRASMGEKEKSIDLYKKIWDDRCLYPLLGNEAQRALKELGVTVHETPAPPPVDPSLKTTMPATTTSRH